MNVPFNVTSPQIEMVSSVDVVDVGTCHPSVCEIAVLSSHSVHAHILDIRSRWTKQHFNKSGVS